MALLVAASVPLAASGAQAHSALVSSTPADGDSISEIPDEIVLEFNEDIEPIGNEVVVTGPSGAEVATDELVVDGPVVTQPIDVDGAGDYTVTWRVVSADGHPISGEFSYELRVPQTLEPAETTEAGDEAETTTTEATTDVATTEDTTATDAETTATDEQESEDSGVPVWLLAVAGAFVLVVALLVIRRVRSR